MNPLGFSRPLARLDPSPDRAAEEYERLRATLEKYFDWRGAWPPEECADETLDRLVQKLESDTRIHDVRSYAHGIARLVLLEWQRRRPALVSMSDDARAARIAAPVAEDEDEQFALSISPVIVRSGGEPATLVVPANTDLIALELQRDPSEQPIDPARALVRTVAGSEVWRGPVAASQATPKMATRLEVPANLLSPDDYIVQLFDADASGRETERNRYFFRVRQR